VMNHIKQVNFFPANRRQVPFHFRATNA
jgi:hypothetical protein